MLTNIVVATQPPFSPAAVGVNRVGEAVSDSRLRPAPPFAQTASTSRSCSTTSTRSTLPPLPGRTYPTPPPAIFRRRDTTTALRRPAAGFTSLAASASQVGEFALCLSCRGSRRTSSDQRMHLQVICAGTSMTFTPWTWLPCFGQICPPRPAASPRWGATALASLRPLTAPSTSSEAAWATLVSARGSNIQRSMH